MKGISAGSRSDLARVTAHSRRFVTAGAAADVLGLPRADASQRLARWAAQGWLRRVRRGLYIPVPIDVIDPLRWNEDSLLIADELWSPCLFTGWTAANHWGLTEQVFRTTVVKTSARVRPADRSVAGHDYLLVHVPESELSWGVRTVWREERRLRFAGPARTVVDALDDPRLTGGIRFASEILLAFLDDPGESADTLVEHADRTGNGSVFKRLGYLVETLRPDLVVLIAACVERVPAGFTLLDPTAQRAGRRITRWGLVLNVVPPARDHA